MRRAAALLALAAAGCGAGGSSPIPPAAAVRPSRVMSMNVCADQLVLALLPPERIASVSWLSRDSQGSLMAAAAARVGINHGQAEEVLAQRPDLVVAGSFTTPTLRAMLKRIDYPLIEVDQPQSLADVRRVTRQVAAAVGERARGEAMIADMDRKFAALGRRPGTRVGVVAWDGTGFSAGAGTLYAEIIAAAGARNLAAGETGWRKPDVEALLRYDPPLLAQGAGDAARPTLGDDLARHRVVRRRWGDRTVTVSPAYYSCGTPMIADAAIRLRRDLAATAARVGTRPPSGEALR